MRKEGANLTSFLVTGASGFVGSHLLNQLVEKGYPVTAVSRRNILHKQPYKTITLPLISSSTNWIDALENVDVVVHLAARVHIMNDKVDNPLAAFREVNLHGTINLARQAARAGIKRFVYVSTIKVNGEFTAGTPFTEDDVPQPIDPYGISKWEAEKALRTISEQTGMEVVIVRPPLIYGPGVKANFHNLLGIIFKGWPLPLNSIDNSRSMVYVGNLVDVLILCAAHPRAAGKTYLVSDGEDISTPGLIRHLANALNRPCRLFSFPVAIMRFFAGIGEKSAAIDRLTQSLVIDSSRIRRELFWVPSFNLDEGIQATADWYIESMQMLRDSD